MAAKFGKLRVAQLLLDKGADPNVEGKYRLTPLHVATHYGTKDVALLLLDRDAKPQCAAKVLCNSLSRINIQLFFASECNVEWMD